MKEKLLKYLIEGLYTGYKKNVALNTAITEKNRTTIDYLMMVNVAQKLNEWNDYGEEHYAIDQEFNTHLFLKNALLPHMIKRSYVSNRGGTRRFEVNRNLTRPIDIAISKRRSDLNGHLESIGWVALNGINPSYSEVVNDVRNLTASIEMSDGKFDSSIENGYSLFVKSLGDIEGLSKKNRLLDAKKKETEQLKNKIAREVEFHDSTFKIYSKTFILKWMENFRQDTEGTIQEYKSYVQKNQSCIVFGVAIEVKKTG